MLSKKSQIRILYLLITVLIVSFIYVIAQDLEGNSTEGITNELSILKENYGYNWNEVKNPDGSITRTIFSESVYLDKFVNLTYDTDDSFLLDWKGHKLKIKLNIDSSGKESPLKDYKNNDLNITNKNLYSNNNYEFSWHLKNNKGDKLKVDSFSIELENLTTMDIKSDGRFFYLPDGLIIDLQDLVNNSFKLEKVDSKKVRIFADVSKGKSLNVSEIDLDPLVSAPSADTYIRSSASLQNTNYGTDTSMDMDDSATDLNRILIQFDTSSIPLNSTILKANISLYTSTSATAQNINAYALGNSWSETQATWKNRTTSVAWTTAGGDNVSSLLSSTSVGNSGWYNFSVTDAVQRWVNGSLTNNGIILIATTGSAHTYRSKEYTGTTYDPYITVTYNYPSPNFTSLLPVNNTNQTSKTVNFQCNITMLGIDSLANITAYQDIYYANVSGYSIDNIIDSTQFYRNSTTDPKENVSASINWTTTIANDGIYYWWCDTDVQYETGYVNTQIPSLEYKITIDSTGPNITYQSQTPTDSSRQVSNSVSINASVNDNLSSIDTCLLEWNNTASITNYTMTKIGSYCNYTITTIDGTNYWFKVYANDTLGNLANSSIRTFKENNKPTKPVVTLTPAIPYKNDTLTCTGSGSTDSDGDSIFYYYQFNDSDGSILSNYTTIPTICYQESVNMSTACGGLNTGTYQSSDSWQNLNNIYDGDWSTYGGVIGGVGEFNANLYITYVKPIGVDSSGNLWQIKSWSTFQNITIPIDCWNNNSNNLYLKFYSYYKNSPENTQAIFYCQNNSGWKQLYSEPYVSANTRFLYEESMNWNITTGAFNCNSSGSCTKTDNITCNVKTYDGYEYSLVNSTNVTIQNFPPDIASWNVSNSTWSTTTATNLSLYENSSGNGTYIFNITSVTDIDTESHWYDFFIDNIKITVSTVQSWYSWILGSYSVGPGNSHNVTAYVNDSSNSKDSQYWNVTIYDTFNPSLSNSVVSPATPATYALNQVYRFNITAIDAHLNNVWIEFNGTNYTSQVTNVGNVYTFNRTDLAAGSYSYKWWGNDTSNNKNFTTAATYTINTATNTLTLNSSKNWTYNYDQNPTNLSCTATFGTPNIYVDGVLVSNPNVSTWDVAAHAVVCNITASQNYSIATTSDTLTVNKIASLTTLSFSPASPQVYGTAINASCTSTGDGTIKLYRGGVDVSSTELNQLVTLASATHNYICNITTGTNYQNSSTTGSYTITNATGNVTLKLNSAETNFTVTYPQQTNVSSTTLYGSVVLYKDGTVITSENNLNVTRGVGYYNITAVSSGDQNHSSATITRWLNVSIASRQTLLTFNAATPQNYLTSINATCLASSGSTDGTLKLYRGGVDVTSTENSQLVTLAAGTHNYVCNITTGTNYSVATNSSSFVINKITSSGTITSSAGWTTTYGTSTTIGISESNTGDSDVTYIVYRDNVSKGTGETVNLGAGTYNYLLNTTGGTNYTANASINTQILTVNPATTVTNVLVNPASGITYGTNSNFSCNNSLGGTPTLYIDGVDKSSERGLNVVRSAATYTINCTTDTTANYSGSSAQTTYTINKASPSSGMSITGTTPIIYTATSDFSSSETNTGDGGCSYSMDRSNLAYGVGSWVFNYSTSGCTNYSSGSVTKTLVVNQNSTYSLAISYNPSSTITYGTAINTTVNGCPSELTCTLYRDSVSITPGVNITLGGGSYNYTYNTTGNTNYTTRSTSSLLTVNRASSLVYTYLNNSRSNITVSQGATIWLNGTLQTGTGSITLYNNGSLINSGTSPLSNNTLFNVLGVLNITTIYAQTQNYSTSSETFWVNVTDTTNPSIIIIYPSNNTNSSNINLNINYTVSDTNLASCWYSNDSMTLNTTLAGCINLTTVTWSQGQHNVTIWVNDTLNNKNSSSVSFTIDSNAPSSTLIYPTNNTYNSTTSQNFTYNVTDNLGVKNSTLIIYNQTGEYNRTVTAYAVNTLTSTVGVVVSVIEGIYKWWVQVFDFTGNSYTTVNNTLTIDTINPSISYNPSTTTNGTWRQTGDVFINVSIIDTNKNTFGYEFNSVNYTTWDATSGNDSWINKTGLATGTYTVYAWVNDSATNFNRTLLNTYYIDLENPTVTILYPEDLSTKNSNTSLPLNFTATDTNLASCWYNFDNGANSSITCTSGNNAGTTFNISEGSHTLNVYANDSSGRVGSHTHTFSVNLALPEIAVTYPSNNLWINYKQNVNFNYTATDSDGISSSQLWGNWTGTWAKNQTHNPTSGVQDTFSVNLTDGSYIWNIWVNDTGNNGVWAFSNNYTLNVDTTYPLVSFGTNTENNNTNFSRTWIYVNVSVTELNEKNITFSLFNSTGGGLNSTTYTNTQRTINWTGLSDGVYYYNITVYDNASNKNSTDTRNLRLDNTAPTLTLASPTSSIYKDLYTYNLTLNVTATDSGIGVSTYKYSLNGASNVSFTPNSSIIAIAGGNNLSVYVNDSLGNTASTSITFNLTFTPIINNWTVSNSTTSYFNITNPTFQEYANVTINATITDEDTSNSNLYFQWFVDGVSKLAGYAQSVFNYIFTGRSNLVQLNVNDSNNYFVNQTWNISTTYINPSINFTSPTELNNSYLNKNNLQVNVTSTDDNLANITIYLYNYDMSLNRSNTTTTSPDFINYTLSDGIYYFNATSTDIVNNKNYTETKKVTIDTTNPLISITSPSSGDYLTSQTFNVLFSISDTNIDSCWYSTNSTVNISMPGGCSATSLSLFLTDNPYNLTIYANDSANNINSQLITFIVDSQAPIINFIAPTQDDNKNVSASYIIVNISYTEPNFASITFKLTTSSGTAINSTLFSSPVTEITFYGLSDEIYNYSVIMNDLASNSRTETRQITLDTDSPSITITNPIDGGNFAYNESINLNYTVIDNLVGVGYCKYDVKNSSGYYFIQNQSIPNCLNTTFSLPAGDIDYDLTLWANDTLGNLRGQGITFGIRTIAPAITLLNPPASSVSHLNHINNVRFNFTVVDASETISSCQLWGNWTGTWHLNQTLTSVSETLVNNFGKLNLTEGTFSYNIFCNDTLNNGNFVSSNRSFTTDITYPKVNITSPINGSSVSTTFAFIYNASDLNINSCHYNLLRNGTWYYSPNLTLACSENGSKSITVADGTYDLYVWARDKASNENYTLTTFTASSGGGGGGGGGGTPKEVIKEVPSNKTFCGDNFNKTGLTINGLNACQKPNDNGEYEDFYSCSQDCPGFNLESTVLYCFDSDPKTSCIWDTDNKAGYIGLFLGMGVFVLFFSTTKDKKTGKQISLVRNYTQNIKSWNKSKKWRRR